MEIPKKYDPKKVEEKWYKHWKDSGFFRSIPDEREPYTIVIPPPNVTGVLHMGHMLNNTIQDVLIRRARLQGYNACWVPGTDHASIATEAKVVQKLRKEGVKKSDISREKFLIHAWEWKENYGGKILTQLQKLGASCDWERTSFTMDPKMSKAVIKVFVDLYDKGYLYRDLKMVNWDPVAQTTLSNEEVIHKEENSRLYHVKYKIAESDEWVTIATTRPETILGDTAICVNPSDDRYKHLKGKFAIVPLVDRKVPIIYDDYVDVEFGTGALKITPAHDTNDYEMGQRHNLETVDIMNDDGTLSDAAEWFVGEDRFKARKLIVKELEQLEQLVKVDEISNKVGYSERNPDTVVEPKLSLQWFVDMQKLVGPAMEHVANDDIKFYPSNYKNVYKHWMENIRDWPISRQLWWGQRIPAYYLEDGTIIVAETSEQALEKAKTTTGNANLTLSDLKQEEDVVDTWFSSWLWPISVLDGFEDETELDYYYPTSVLVTGWDIIFFWVARMIMAGYEFKNEKPFKDVYFTGMVRDTQRRKMSKSLGNSPDALELIENFGADGVRVGMLLSAPAGNDLLFDEKLCEQGRNFSNKIWNAVRLVKGWEIYEGENTANNPAITWFENRLNQVIEQVEKSYKEYRLSEVLMSLYTLVWDDFCSWYLEMIKPEYEKPIDSTTYTKTIELLEKLMQLLHPFMPFITEEVWHIIKEREESDCLIVSEYPKVAGFDAKVLEEANIAKEVISKVRDIRNKNNLKQKEALELFAVVSNAENYNTFKPLIEKLAYLGTFEFVDAEIEDAQTFMVKSDQFFVNTGIEIDPEVERAKLTEEIKYTKGFIKSVEGKLSNERFVNNAPEAVVNKERAKLSDGQEKLKVLEDSLAKLN